MSKRLVLEVEFGKRRANLSVLDDEDRGHGHRLCGPKYAGEYSKPDLEYVLNSYDRDALRKMLDEVEDQ
jgi:hypothetical protein